MSLIYISPFSSGSHNHIVQDDSFYTNVLAGFKKQCTAIVGKTSKTNLSKRHRNLKLINNKYTFFKVLVCCIQNLKEKNCYIFNGYNEIYIMPFIILAFIRREAVLLLPTNNLGFGRLKRHQTKLKLLYWLTKPFNVFFILNSRQEFSGLCRIISKPKVYFKLYHGCKFQIKKKYKKAPKKHKVVFLGPPKEDKPFLSYLEFYRLNNDLFDFYGLNVPCEFLNDSSKNKIKIVNSDLTDKQLKRYLSKFQFIFCSHTPDYFGKLTGNYCDALKYNLIAICDYPNVVELEINSELQISIPASEFSLLSKRNYQSVEAIRQQKLKYLFNLFPYYAYNNCFNSMSKVIYNIMDEMNYPILK